MNTVQTPWRADAGNPQDDSDSGNTNDGQGPADGR
ncbi:hypothetical protein SAMN05192584_12274 [Streptomyces pini]|uniref:Uncharacterized protein n=1 Tax=Streptomyces pini TaxID=1520580 RepID=A0A1I4J1C8_9ACTN|nr:hypothetical protein SAMN05192584_12274 [Streptomyces pini]